MVIEQSYGGPKITKDGVTVAKSIELKDRYQNVGASLVKQVASATNDVAGDGKPICPPPPLLYVMPATPKPALSLVTPASQLSILMPTTEVLTRYVVQAWKLLVWQILGKKNTSMCLQRMLTGVALAGTTTATVLTRAIFSEGCKSVAAGMNPMDLRRGINAAVEKVLGYLKHHAKMISTTEEIAQVCRLPLFLYSVCLEIDRPAHSARHG